MAPQPSQLVYEEPDAHRRQEFAGGQSTWVIGFSLSPGIVSPRK